MMGPHGEGGGGGGGGGIIRKFFGYSGSCLKLRVGGGS